jgi:hypothetical protein
MGKRRNAVNKIDRSTAGRDIIQTAITNISLVPALLILLGVVGVVTLVILAVIWYTGRPEFGDPDKFVVAVAEFQQLGGEDDLSIGRNVTLRLAEDLDYQYTLAQLDDVQVIHRNLGIIGNNRQGANLAKTVNADIIIYGTVSVSGETIDVDPRFYLTDAALPEASELIGFYSFAKPITFTRQQVFRSDDPNTTELRERATIVTEFTKCIVYLASGDTALLTQADQSIRRAIDYATGQDFNGKEALYLFATVTATRSGNFDAAQLFVEEALRINANYGRAYLAQGNIFYGQAVKHYELQETPDVWQEEFAAALDSYLDAAQPRGSDPANAYVAEKAYVSIGNVYQFEYQIAADSEKHELGENAITYYQRAIASYLRTPTDELQDLAARAYYGAGVIYQYQGEYCTAAQAYQQTLTLSHIPSVLKRAENRLQQIDEAARQC